MKDFFKTNKNQVMLFTYIILVGVVVLNWNTAFSSILYIVGLFTPLYYAISIAFVLNLPMNAIERQLKKLIPQKSFMHRYLRTFSLILTLIFAVIIFYLLCIIIIPRVASSLEMVFSNFGVLFNSTIDSINDIFRQFNIDFQLQDVSAVKELQNLSWNEVFDKIIVLLGQFADGFVSNAIAFTNTFLEWFLSFCLSIYLLAGKEKLIQQCRKVVLALCSLNVSDRIFSIGTQANIIFSRFVGGQLVDCAIKGIMFYVTFKLINFPLPELCAAIITVCSIVPVFGPIVAMAIDAILIFAFDPVLALGFIILFQILSNLESQIIYPRIVGKSIGLPGIWVLLSIFVLGDAWGLAGMIFAVPITALLYTLFTEFIGKRLKRKDESFLKGKLKLTNKGEHEEDA